MIIRVPRSTISILIFLLFGTLLFSVTLTYAEKRTRPPVQTRLQCLRTALHLKRTPDTRQPTRISLIKKYNECIAATSLAQKIIETANANRTNFLISLKDANLLSKELTTTFDEKAFQQSQDQASTEQGQILEVTIDPYVNVFGDWMESNLTMKTENSTQDYLVVFHREDGNWKLFGTIPK